MKTYFFSMEQLSGRDGRVVSCLTGVVFAETSEEARQKALEQWGGDLIRAQIQEVPPDGVLHYSFLAVPDRF